MSDTRISAPGQFTLPYGEADEVMKQLRTSPPRSVAAGFLSVVVFRPRASVCGCCVRVPATDRGWLVEKNKASPRWSVRGLCVPPRPSPL